MMKKVISVKVKRKVVSLFLVLALMMGVTLVSVPQMAVAAVEIYKDATQPVEARVADLLSRMTLDEKIGQMIQAEMPMVSPDEVKEYMLGSVLSGGGSVPVPNTPEAWCDMIDGYQKAAMSTRLQIPYIYGSDAVHGHNNAYGATIFPHNIGIGATRDADLVKRIGAAVAEEVRGTGIPWSFSPCVAVVQNIRWGRTYESYSENTDVVTQLGTAFTKGLQGDNYLTSLKSPDKIAACIKHYIGDGATEDGINAGDAKITEAEIRQKYLPPYIEAIKAGARTVMVSFNTINGVECHMNTHLITDILKDELKFDGFVISDWNGTDDNDKADYVNAIKLGVNAGIDMLMVPAAWKDAISAIKTLAETGEIEQSRIDDAVTRILRVKFQLGLFENPYADREMIKSVGSQEHRDLAREAVRKSLVLLKNDNQILPLSKNGKKIFVAGKNTDDIGNQCGGWTLSWRGMSGDITPGTTILQGIKNAVGPDSTVTYSRMGEGAEGSDVAIVVVGEYPYAEQYGDSNDLSLDVADEITLENIKATGVPTVVVTVSGRPLTVSDQIKDWNALVAAWLPGTEGAGVADCLFGDYDFTGKLPFTWPMTTSQLPIIEGDGKTPLFSYGYGLSMKPVAEGNEEFKVETTFNPQLLVPNNIITAKVKVTNNSKASYTGVKNVLMIVALHDKKNTMRDICFISKGVPYLGTETLSAGFKLPADVSGYTVKSFVWDGEDLTTTQMIPLSNVVQIP